MKDSKDDRFYYVSKAFWYIIKINISFMKHSLWELLEQFCIFSLQCEKMVYIILWNPFKTMNTIISKVTSVWCILKIIPENLKPIFKKNYSTT